LTWSSKTACAFSNPHATIRQGQQDFTQGQVDHLEIEDWCQAGFYVHYDNGQTAEVSWAFIRELPPKNCPHCNNEASGETPCVGRGRIVKRRAENVMILSQNNQRRL